MQTTTQYVSGRGYTVRDAAGKVIAHSLSPSQLAALQAGGKVADRTLLDAIK